VCWGLNKDGQLGDMADEDSAVPVSTFGVIRYTSIATGDSHTCGSTDKGKVFCWGSNTKGELGNASATPSHVPFPARFNRKVVVIQMAAGAAHTCALTGENELFCWGDNRAGQVGNGKTGRQLSPTALKDQTGFTAVTAGGSVTCALRGSAGSSKVPVPALSGTTLKSISLGQARGCGVQADGTTICWAQGALESR
jgi:alpha-tubulin suppressor-like RCC1 family protein